MPGSMYKDIFIKYIDIICLTMYNKIIIEYMLLIIFGRTSFTSKLTSNECHIDVKSPEKSLL